MGEFAIGQSVPRFEDPRLLQGRRPLCRRHGPAGHGVRLCAALAARPCAHSLDRHDARPRPRRACSPCSPATTGQASGWGDLPVPGRTEAARRQRRLPAALSGAGQGPGALGRRLCRLRGRRDLAPGARRGRADRGRLRAAARHRVAPPSRQRPARRGSGRIARTISASSRSVGDKAATEAAFAKAASRRQAALRHQPRHRRERWSRAAASATTTRPRTATRSTPRCSARIPSAPSCRQARAEGAREQDPRGRRRHRRQLRHEVGDLQRGRRWCCWPRS